jgi:beta-glucosidase
VLKSGFNYIFAPTVAVSHNPQWGRYYETMGSTKENVYWYAQSFVKGAQNVQYSEMGGVMTSTKHFIGDGATFNGNDEGNNQV